MTGNFEREVLINTNNSEQLAKGLCALRRTFKKDFYKVARLQPRMSDVDRHVLETRGVDGSEGADGSSGDEAEATTTDKVSNAKAVAATTFVENEVTVAIARQIVDFLKTNNPNMPVACRQSVPAATNQSMLSMLLTVGQKAIENNKVAAETMMNSVIEQVELSMPKEWDDIAQIVEDAKNHDVKDFVAALSDEAKVVIDLGVYKSMFDHMRMQLTLFIMTNLGGQACVLMDEHHEGKTVTATYLPELSRTGAAKLGEIVQAAYSASLAMDSINDVSDPVPPNVSAFIELYNATGWREALSAWFKQLAHWSEHVIKYDGVGYAKRRAELEQFLTKATTAAINKNEYGS